MPTLEEGVGRTVEHGGDDESPGGKRGIPVPGREPGEPAERRAEDGEPARVDENGGARPARDDDLHPRIFRLGSDEPEAGRRGTVPTR
jgi:hypothetical protein